MSSIQWLVDPPDQSNNSATPRSGTFYSDWMIGELWPLFDLRIRTPRLELRIPTDSELAKAVEAVKAVGVHDETIPFVVDWTNSSHPQFAQDIAQYHWRQRAVWQPTGWNLETFAFLEDEPIGGQTISAADFKNMRQTETGSWLLKGHQGIGLGKEMRAAVLELAFVYLEAHETHSGSREGNARSSGVSQSLGYEHNGYKRTSFGGQVDTEDMWRLTKERWQSHRPDFKITVEGFDKCRAMFGLD